MKKTVITLLLLFALAPLCRAQDTVGYMDPCYMFNERHPYTVFPWGPNPFDLPYAFPPSIWSWDKFCSWCYSWGWDQSAQYALSNQQEPVPIYGVALTVEGINRIAISEEDIPKYPYDVILAVIENNALVIIDSTTWDSQKDTKRCFKYSLMGGDGVFYEHFVPVYEYYFDSPVMMSDTFYVGFRRTVPYYDDVMYDYYFNTVCAIDSLSQTWITNENLQGGRTPYWGGAFPIIQPNRHCSVPEAPEWLVYTTTNTVRFTLPYTEGDSLILSIAREGQPADSGTIYPVTGAVMDIVVPDSGRYSARLARICQRDIEVQSRWSAPANFFLLNSLAIGRGPGAAQAFDIYPNPASGTVTVDCEAREGTLEVVDLQGRTLLTAPATQRSLDISRLPAGSYFVRLTTPDGSAVRQLAVEN